MECSDCDTHHHGDPHDEVFEDEDQRELEHYRNIIASFANYELYTLQFIMRLENQFNRLSDIHKSLLPEMSDKLKHLRSACKLNYHFIKQIIANERIFENSEMVLFIMFIEMIQCFNSSLGIGNQSR